MKTAMLIVLAASGLVGCNTSRENAGGTGPAYETSTGRGYGMESDMGMTADPRGSWESWRFGGDPDRIPPRSPSDNRVVPPTRNP
jgi:hypothetical protein